MIQELNKYFTNNIEFDSGNIEILEKLYQVQKKLVSFFKTIKDIIIKTVNLKFSFELK